jgi:LacI family transcriptional regulator
METPLNAEKETGRKTVTMKDVARRVGVHHSSVSVVLNGSRSSAGISSATRQRILEAAEELGYRRNGSAHTIRTGRFGNVALLLSPNRGLSYLPPQLLAGLYDALTAADMTLTVCLLPDEELNDTGTLPKILREQMSDGLLIDYNKSIPAPMIETIARHRIPAVWINSKQPNDCVYPDDLEAGQQATRHLLEIGHRRIAYVDLIAPRADDPTQHYSRRDRRDGYRAAMAQAGLEARVWGVDELNLDEVDSCVELLSSPDRPTAVISYASWATEPIAYAALMLGLQIPNDLSVLGFGPEQTLYLCRPMSVMLEPQFQIGQSATKMLLQKIEHPAEFNAPQPVRFEFCEGKSTAPL